MGKLHPHVHLITNCTQGSAALPTRREIAVVFFFAATATAQQRHSAHFVTTYSTIVRRAVQCLSHKVETPWQRSNSGPFEFRMELVILSGQSSRTVRAPRSERNRATTGRSR